MVHVSRLKLTMLIVSIIERAFRETFNVLRTKTFLVLPLNERSFGVRRLRARLPKELLTSLSRSFHAAICTSPRELLSPRKSLRANSGRQKAGLVQRSLDGKT